MVFALPTARIAVMGPAGKDYVYKDEVSSIQKEYQENVKKGMSEKEAIVIRDKKLQTLSTQYEKELMNPKEALSLGSVSRIVLPGTTRNILFQNLDYLIRHYKPAPLSGPQREFE